jgi:hypothetical protein
MIVTTEHGTKFKIDFDNKTWERIDKTGDSGNLRTESGTYVEIVGPVIGKSLQLWCPPFTEHSGARLIMTSLITRIEE